MNKEINIKAEHLISLIDNINSRNSFPDIVKYIYSSFSEYIPYEYIGIALIENDNEVIKAYHGISADTIKGLPENLFGLEFDLSQTTLGDILKTGKPRIINDLEEYIESRPRRQYNDILLEAGVASSVTLPLIINGRPIGFIFFSSSIENIYNNAHINFLKPLANSISLILEKTKFTNDLIYTNILSLAKLAESRDNDTGDHLKRMKKYSRLVAELLYKSNTYRDEIDLDFIDDIEKFSPLHDIGKVGVQDGILLKPGKLSPEEFHIMKKHTVYGAQVLREAEKNVKQNGRSIFKLGIEITENHHEKWDGSGYPLGKKGIEIPLSARIVTIGDVFDALTSKRPYKKPFSFDKSFKIITDGKGKHFDPKIIDVLEQNKISLQNLYNEFYT